MTKISAKLLSCGQAANIARISLQILKFFTYKFHIRDGRHETVTV